MRLTHPAADRTLGAEDRMGRFCGLALAALLAMAGCNASDDTTAPASGPEGDGRPCGPSDPCPEGQFCADNAQCFDPPRDMTVPLPTDLRVVDLAPAVDLAVPDLTPPPDLRARD